MSMQTSTALKGLGLGLVLAAAGSVTPLGAQNVDARWLPWMGCWQATAGEAGSSDLLCVRPAEQAGGMDFLRISDDIVVAREVVWADGRRHETAREACTGWEQGDFSADGRRIFLSSEYTCDGSVVQEGGGIIAMASPMGFVDIRVAGMDGDNLAWVQHFRAADPADAVAAGFGDILADRAWSVSQARMAASAPLDVDDVIEATEWVAPEAVEALLVERGDRMDIQAAELVRLADAGVPESVIDVAVATSYPESFRLASGVEGQPAPRSALDDGSLRRRWGMRGSMGYDPFMPWSLAFGYGYYGYGYSPYRYGYSPYGYGYGYGGYGYGGYSPVIIRVDRGGNQPHGRVVNGRGYTQGRSSGGAPSRGYVPRSTGSSPAASGGGGRSGSSTGRTAKPRGGGSSGAAAASSGGDGKSPANGTGRKAKPRSGGGF